MRAQKNSSFYKSQEWGMTKKMRDIAKKRSFKEEFFKLWYHKNDKPEDEEGNSY